MQINPDYNPGVYTVRSYKTGQVEVFEPIPVEQLRNMKPGEGVKPDNILVLKESFIITPKHLNTGWKLENPHLLDKKVFQQLMEYKPELLIVGTGKKIHFPETTATLPLLQAGIGVEVMDTAAACRTYNFLVADGRDVAAAIFMIEE